MAGWPDRTSTTSGIGHQQHRPWTYSAELLAPGGTGKGATLRCWNGPPGPVWCRQPEGLLGAGGAPLASCAEQAGERAYKSRALQRAAAAGRLSCPAIGTAASAHGAAEACPFSWLDATNYPWD